MFAGPAFDFAVAEAFDDIQVHRDGMVLLVQRHRRDKWRLVLGASPAFSTAMLAAPVDVIQLDNADQRFAIIPLFHRLHDLVLETPGGVVGHADLPHQGQRRQGSFSLRQHMNRQKPRRERQLGLLKQRTADQRGLVIACRALIQVARVEMV